MLNTVATPLNARCGDTAGDLACAISNMGVLAQTWPYEDDDGNTAIQPFAFFEGGINVTQTLAARKLGISRSTLWRKLKSHGIAIPREQ